MHPIRAGIRAKPLELLNAGIERISSTADQVTRNKCHMGIGFVRHVNGARQQRLANEWAQVNVAELHKAQPLKILRQPGKKDINFAKCQRFPTHERGRYQPPAESRWLRLQRLSKASLRPGM